MAVSVLVIGTTMNDPRSPVRSKLIATVLLVGILGFLAWFAVPSINGSPPSPYRRIILNLLVIQNQKQLWAADKKKTDQDTPTEADLAEYFNTGRFPSPVVGETYRINPVGKAPVAIVPKRVRYGKKVIEAGGEITLEEIDWSYRRPL